MLTITDCIKHMKIQNEAYNERTHGIFVTASLINQSHTLCRRARVSTSLSPFADDLSSVGWPLPQANLPANRSWAIAPKEQCITSQWEKVQNRWQGPGQASKRTVVIARITWLWVLWVFCINGSIVLLKLTLIGRAIFAETLLTS